MLKALKEKLYNRKMQRKLKDVIFAGFINYPGVPHPVFAYVSDKEKESAFILAPETVEIFKLCVSKLSNDYISKKARISFEKQVKDYFNFYNFNYIEIKNCMDIFDAKQYVIDHPEMADY